MILKCLSEAFKTVAGGIYLDSRSLNTVWKVHYPWLLECINKLDLFVRKPTDALTKLSRKVNGKPIIWEFEQDDDGRFKAQLILSNLLDVFEGTGETKDFAKLHAAQNCLDWMKSSKLGKIFVTFILSKIVITKFKKYSSL